MRKTLLNTMGLVLALFGATNVYAQSTVELPYSITFDSTNDVWTVLDASPTPGTSWEFNNDWGNDGFCIGNAWTATPSYCIRTDSGEPNDYYVSPSFSLKAGKTYTVKTSSGTMYSTPAKLSVEYTTTPADAASFTKLSDIDMPSSGVQYDNSYDLTVPKDGLYSFAFHATNTSAGDKSNWAYLYALGFSVEEKVGGETPDPGPDPDPDKPDPPVEDQDGTLPYDMTFDSAEKFATWTTMDNSETPGVTWAYTASDFAGKPAAHMGVDAKSETCDWLVSPKFELKEGKSYTITVDAASGPNNELNLILDYFVGSKSADNQKTIEWIGSKLPATVGESGEVKNQWTLDANKDGVYLFAFRALNWGANNANDAISIYSVKIEEKADGEPDAPVALPYEVSFEQEENVAAWTAMDRSGNTGSTWSWNSWGYQEYDTDWNPVGDQHPCVSFSSDWNTDANDYWVSPAFALEAGKTYVAKAHTANNRSCLESGTTSFTMKLGTNKKVQSSFDQTLGSIELNTVYDRDPSSFEFSVQESGNYYVAFHISDSEGANAYGYIFDFSLAEKEGAAEEPVATAPVANLAAAEIATAKSVELTWTNPTKDVDGKDLPADAALTVKVYEGEELLATLDAQAPGSEGKYTKEYTADTFAGEHNYKVVVVYKEKESDAATATLTVVVDAINGVLVPADAKVSVHTLGGAAVGNNLSTLGKGTYIVTMKRADGTMKTVKVTK